MNDNNMEAVASEDWFTRELFLKVEQERDELRAEVEQIREAFDTRLREADPEGIWWMEVATLRAENERLRAALEKIAGMGHVSIDWAIETAREVLNVKQG